MSKSSPVLTLALPPRQPGTPAYLWLCDVIRSGILEGRLPPGSRLPPTRQLAEQYGLSRGTVVATFEQLRAEGYITARTGSGTYVCPTIPEHLLVAGGRRSASRGRAATPRTSAFMQRIETMQYFETPSSRAFRANQPALDLFPTTLWAQVAGRRLRRASVRDLLGGDALGHRPLREAVASYLNTSRGVKCTADQVAIVSGFQEAADLVSRMLLNPGDRVAVEAPGYRGAAHMFRALGAEVVPVPVDEEGMRIPPVAARMAYITPAHQYPLGFTMSLPRRMALLEWARSNDALLLEDDYDAEYRYSGRPMPALQSLDTHGVVLFTGTFSKVLFPSLRLAYLVVPESLVDEVAAIRSIVSRYPPVLEQAVLCDFITEGHFGRHIRRMREIYARRLQALLDGAERYLSSGLEFPRAEAGLQTVGWLNPGTDARAITRAAARRNVEVTSLDEVCVGGRLRQGLQVGFAAVDIPEIGRGVLELAAVLDSSTTQRRATRAV